MIYFAIKVFQEKENDNVRNTTTTKKKKKKKKKFIMINLNDKKKKFFFLFLIEFIKRVNEWRKVFDFFIPF